MLGTLKRIVDWTGPYKGRLALGSVCSFFATWCTAGPIAVTAYYIAAILGAQQGADALGPDAVWQSLLAVAALVALRFAFTYGKCRLQESIGYEVAAAQRMRIGEVLKRVPLGYFSKVGTGEILAGLTSELSTLELDGMKMVDRILNGYVNILAVAVFLGVFCPPAVLAVVGGVCVSALGIRAINRHSAKAAAAAHRATEDMAKATIECVHGLSVIKSYGTQGSSMERFRDACSRSRAVNIDVQRGFVPANTLHLFALRTASVALVLVAVQQGLGGSLDAMPVLMISLFAFTVFSSIEPVNDASHIMGVIESAMDKLDDIERADFIDEGGRDVPLERFDIEFDDVSFSYGDREVVCGASFAVPQNTTCAIVGPSGSGKSTICSLIARFYDVDGGAVRVGGVDVREMTCDSLLRHVSMVFQNVYLFHDTVRSNIAFGRPGATEEEIVDAAKKACCHDFVTALPDGYDTVVGEGGSTLSGGEKQRISLARAILKDAPIVILDEATASVDPENERSIQEAISALTHGKTIVTIAHRLATIEHADQILVVDEGRIVQRGTHAELASRPGLYRRFVDIRRRAEGWTL